MNTTIGTCSRCGGRVSVPSNWMSVVPAVPTCEGCGARPVAPHGPVIEMGEPHPLKVTATDNTGHRD